MLYQGIQIIKSHTSSNHQEDFKKGYRKGRSDFSGRPLWYRKVFQLLFSEPACQYFFTRCNAYKITAGRK
jgi:hypothetical protein